MARAVATRWCTGVWQAQEIDSKQLMTNTLPAPRARALDAFLPLLPSNVSVEFSAHVTKVENIRCSDERPARVQLSIAPSEHRDPEWQGNVRTFDADIVIGCDGVKSAVRHSLGLTGQDGSGGQVRYTGSYAYRELLDMETAVRMNGEGVRVPAMWYAPGKACRLIYA
jgi:salicylate hydroxylase